MQLIKTRAQDLQNKLRDLLQKIRSLNNHKCSKYRIHIIILISAILYLILAPKIYANYFINFGKPINFNGEIPLATDDIKFNIDSNETIIIDGQKFQQIAGWAFLTNELDQSKYEKHLVLNSESRTYFFAYETVKRPDVQGKYKDEGLDVLSSGFRALISGANLHSGTYNVGFLFKNPADDKAYYSVSNQYLDRSPNHITVKMGEKPEVNASVKLDQSFKNSLQDGMDIEINKPLPEQTDKIKSNVETLSRVSINGKSYERLAGWAFLTEETPQANYERIIILESNAGTFYFPTIPLDRPDVEEAYDFLNIDLDFSGFETYFMKTDLPYGTYEIGIVFLDNAGDPIYYSKMDNLLIWSADKFELQRK